MYQQENTTTQQHGQRPAEHSADALVEHLTAVLHPLTPKNLYDDISCALSILAEFTDALGHPDCTRIIIHAAAERQKVGGRKQFVDLRDEENEG